MKYCNCEFGCDCEGEIALLRKAFELACKDRALFGGSASLFERHYMTQAEIALAPKGSPKTTKSKGGS